MDPARIILITGASTGIGAETARHLAPGNRIFIHYFASEAAAKGVASDVLKAGGDPVLVRADVSTEAGCQDLVSFVAGQTDRLDVLINNAGSMIRRQALRELAWDLMDESFRLNVFSALFITSRLVPLLEKAADPCVINITSIAMRHGAPTATIYGAAKSALDSFTRGAARELAPKIRVNAVAPGVIETPFHERFSTPDRLQAFRDTTPLRRNGQPRHVALSIAHLIDNDFLTGETIDVNGGLFTR